MKIIRFTGAQGKTRYGHDYNEKDHSATLLEGDHLFDEQTGRLALKDTGQRTAVSHLLAPLEPRAILCIGLNYRQHAMETGAAIPTVPVLFMKNPAAVCAPGQAIHIPAPMVTKPEVDFEVELAVVIGRRATNVTEAAALGHVLGYTVGNDVSARVVQKQGNAGQWVRGKSFDTFCPLGPALVTADELHNPQGLRLTTTLNGEVMQDSSTGDMIFSVARLIAYLSTDMTLLPGTVILTGTPSGVGVARKPQVFLKPGDKLELEIESIGKLVNPVTA